MLLPRAAVWRPFFSDSAWHLDPGEIRAPAMSSPASSIELTHHTGDAIVQDSFDLLAGTLIKQRRYGLDLILESLERTLEFEAQSGAQYLPNERCFSD